MLFVALYHHVIMLISFDRLFLFYACYAVMNHEHLLILRKIL